MMLGGAVLAISGSNLISSKELQLPQHYLLRDKTVTWFGFCIKPLLV
jgi:hypothetical protein